MNSLKVFIILNIFLSIPVSAKSNVGSVAIEEESGSFVDELKIVRDAGEDVEVIFVNHKGIFLLSHTVKKFNESKNSLLRIQKLKWKAKISYDKMTDQIQSVEEVEVKEDKSQKNNNKYLDF